MTSSRAEPGPAHRAVGVHAAAGNKSAARLGRRKGRAKDPAGEPTWYQFSGGRLLLLSAGSTHPLDCLHFPKTNRHSVGLTGARSFRAVMLRSARTPHVAGGRLNGG